MRVEIGVPPNHVLVGFFLINHPAIGAPPCMETPISKSVRISPTKPSSCDLQVPRKQVPCPEQSSVSMAGICGEKPTKPLVNHG